MLLATGSSQATGCVTQLWSQRKAWIRENILQGGRCNTKATSRPLLPVLYCKIKKRLSLGLVAFNNHRKIPSTYKTKHLATRETVYGPVLKMNYPYLYLSFEQYLLMHSFHRNGVFRKSSQAKCTGGRLVVYDRYIDARFCGKRLTFFFWKCNLFSKALLDFKQRIVFWKQLLKNKIVVGHVVYL
jgi:hypothetical protein